MTRERLALSWHLLELLLVLSLIGVLWSAYHAVTKPAFVETRPR